jgi:hypothetical protein
MPTDPVHPDQLDGEQWFRADLLAYLDSLPVGALAELLAELPSRRQQPLQLGVLLVALNERLPDGYKLPPAGHPGPGEGPPALAAPGTGTRSRAELRRRRCRLQTLVQPGECACCIAIR